MPRKSESVFEKYAHEYDLMTNAVAREKPHEREVLALIERFHPTHVLDAGCGSGLTTMLFAKHEVEAVGLDRSKEMLAVASEKYSHTGLPLSFVQGSFERLSKKLHAKFDLVVCLANSISGVDSRKGLLAAMKSFYAALTPSGTVVLQLLNYASIPEGEIMPVRATSADGKLYIRFTERLGKRQQLYAIRVDMMEAPPSFEVFRHGFDGFTSAEISAAMTRAGFERIKRFGKLDLSEPFTRRSRDLVVVTRKP